MLITTQTASAIATLTDGRVEGNPSQLISSIGKIDKIEPGSLCFLANRRYEKHLYEGRDMTVLVEENFVPKRNCKSTLIYVKDVYGSFSKILEEYTDEVKKDGNVDPLASINQSAILGENVIVGKFTVIEKGVIIGGRSHIYDQVYIGENVKIGSNVRLYPGVKVYQDSVIGDNVIIHANAVIGSDGFGFFQNLTKFHKIPQVGNVIIESDVEIGSGTTIDRATLGSTLIKKGAKLDNLIQIGHNVIIGENAVIAAQTGVAGSSEIGKGSMIGGQTGISGHLKIAPFSKIQAKSGIASSIKEPGKKWYGYPIISYMQYLRAYAVFKKLPSLLKRITQLEEKLKEK